MLPPSDFTVLLRSGKVEHLELYDLDLQGNDFQPEQWAAVESLRCWSVGPELSRALQRIHQHACPPLKKLDVALALSQRYACLLLADRHLDQSIALFADTLESLRITITPGMTPPPPETRADGLPCHSFASQRPRRVRHPPISGRE